MPFLNINGGDLDSFWVYSAMAFPNDDQKRAEFITVNYYRLQAMSPNQPVVSLPIDQLAVLVGADSYIEVMKRAACAAGPGSIVGDLLGYIVTMRLAGHPEPSIRKAIYLAQQYNEGASNAFDKKPATSEIGIRNYWNEYRTVAHLWAAHRTFQQPGSPYSGDDVCLLDPDAFRTFLAVAEWYRNVGETCISAHAKNPEPLLPTADMWRVPADFTLPDFDVTQGDMPGWMKDRLAGYAKRDFC